MKKAFPYLSLCIIGFATVLNILYLLNIIVSAAWVRIGGIAAFLGVLLERFIYDEKKESPFYFKNLKKRPIASGLFIIIALAFVVSYVFATILH